MVALACMMLNLTKIAELGALEFGTLGGLHANASETQNETQSQNR